MNMLEGIANRIGIEIEHRLELAYNTIPKEITTEMHDARWYSEAYIQIKTLTGFSKETVREFLNLKIKQL